MDRLPWLTLEKILSFLDPVSLSYVGACNSALYDAANSDRLWVSHVRRRGWDRYGPGGSHELQPCEDEECVNEASNKVSNSSPRFVLDPLLRREALNTILPECCQWHQVFLRGIHLDANWRLGRYSVWSRIPGHRGRTSRIADMCCDGQMAVTGGSDGSVCLWRLQIPGNAGTDPESAPVSLIRRIELEEEVVSLALSDAHLAVAISQGLVSVYSRADVSSTQRVLRPAPPDVEISLVRAAPLCSMLAAVTEPFQQDAHAPPSVNVYTWDLAGDAPAAAFEAVHTDEVTCAEVDGALLLTGAWDGTVAVLDLARGVKVAHLHDTHDAGVTCLCSRAGPPLTSLLTGGADGSVTSWRFVVHEDTGDVDLHPLWTVQAVEGDGEVYCVDCSEAGVVSGGSDSQVRLWSWQGELRRVMAGHHGVVRHLALLGPHRLVSAGDVKMVFVWNLEREEEAPVRLHRNSTLVGRMWVSDTAVLIASPNAPAEFSALSFW